LRSASENNTISAANKT
jgi:hypothetical protein